MDAELTARRGLIDQLTAGGSIRSDRVRGAFERVRRSAFIPGVPLDQVYADRTHTVAEAGGITVSTVSAPSMQATMLEIAAPMPGESVLEIGSGGTNAALLAEMVAPRGSVWTVDIDQRVIDRARASLAQHPTPVPVRADLVDAWAPDTAIASGSFDLVQFTVDTWTFPTWLPGVLRPGARVVAPMGLCGIGCGWAFEHDRGGLVGRRSFGGGFVAARGAGTEGEALEEIRSGDVVLAPDRDLSAGWLESVLSREAAPTGTVDSCALGAPILPQFLRLLCGPERAGRIRSASQTKENGFPGTSWMRTPVWLADDGLAVIDHRRAGDGVDFFVRSFGSDGPELAERMAERLRAWREDAGGPVLEAIPVSEVAGDAPEETRVLRRGPWEFRLRWER
ncbi:MULTISPECIES: methyltransferase domain-containing protein [unclassified Microbacterium]|uniref:methyltransferase domain-containing protein n=1 Tax=unclassified Microbacterium TaxID=2609290 RepID=UPI0012F79DF3|nr:methyltransferase domain-containing protein [Microbacterium sp. MAH-37]MVQ43141.1 methyltransferase domain-containing protein [Microbacterium sp. MAH-37]